MSEQSETPVAATATAASPVVRGDRKLREGLVVSDKMEKTIVVELEDRVKHPRYSKVIRRTSKVKAHDAEGIAGESDPVNCGIDPVTKLPIAKNGFQLNDVCSYNAKTFPAPVER